MHGHRAISVIIALTLAILPGSVADAAQKKKKGIRAWQSTLGNKDVSSC